MNLRGDDRGATIVEFALIAPVLLMTVMGLMDMAYNMYTSAIVQGAIQKVARDSSIEGAGTAALDARVTAAVRSIVPLATLNFTRKSYTNFANVNEPEDYDDSNGNGRCDNGEIFEDANSNGTYDTDRGASGQGGARDAVLYTVTVTYTRAFPLSKLLGLSNQVTMSTRTILRNQPYTIQAVSSATGNCS